MSQNVKQALLAARAQGPCSCASPSPCYPVASSIVVSLGLHPPAAICNACRGLLCPPPPSPTPAAFLPLA